MKTVPSRPRYLINIYLDYPFKKNKLTKYISGTSWLLRRCTNTRVTTSVIAAMRSSMSRRSHFISFFVQEMAYLYEKRINMNTMQCHIYSRSTVLRTVRRWLKQGWGRPGRRRRGRGGSRRSRRWGKRWLADLSLSSLMMLPHSQGITFGDDFQMPQCMKIAQLVEIVSIWPSYMSSV